MRRRVEVLVGVLVGVIFARFSLIPGYSRILEVRDERRILMAELEQVKGMEDAANVLKKKVRELKRELKGGVDDPRRFIVKVALESDFSILGTTEESFSFMCPGYLDLLNFISKLAEADGCFGIKSFEIKRTENGLLVKISL